MQRAGATPRGGVWVDYRSWPWLVGSGRWLGRQRREQDRHGTINIAKGWSVEAL